MIGHLNLKELPVSKTEQKTLFKKSWYYWTKFGGFFFYFAYF